MPRWFWLLPALAAALWWPLWPYYASDDFIAVAYAQDLDAVAHDFVGPQYAATDVWSFYRPLITLSFWIDQAMPGFVELPQCLGLGKRIIIPPLLRGCSAEWLPRL